MDVLTHGLVGAALAQSSAPRDEVRIAALVGLGAGMLPDADALLASGTDPLQVVEYHRHFTHALAFVPLGALAAALLFWPLLRRRATFGRLYRYAFLGYALAGLLDACTSYGTHLWWPFSDARTAWGVIAIVDPFFSLALGAAVLTGLARRSPGPARVGVAVAAAYLALGAVQHERAERLAHTLASARGHAAERLGVKPTVGNLVLWRSTYASGGRVFADGVRPGLLAQPRLYPGESAALYDAAQDPSAPPHGSRARRDVERFAALSDGMVARDPTRPELLGDARYALLPTSVEPLWGIVLPADPARHVDFVTNRRLTPAKRRRFVAMLLGRDEPR